MALDPDFLQLLACPATRKPLHELPAAELAALNDRIARGGVRDRGGSAVGKPLAAALKPDGERHVYPIQDGIPMLRTTDAIPLDAVAAAKASG